jgi:FKBP-type peptidyl-prolyl cis-trans isomerase
MNKTKKRVLIGTFVIAFVAITIPMFFVFAGDGGGYKKTPNGLQYRIIKDNKKPKAKIGDFISIHMTYKTDFDSVLFTTRQMNNNEPVEIPVTPPQFKGDATEGFTLLGIGDSAEFKMPVDSIFKGQLMPSFAKPGGYIHMFVNVVKVMSKEEKEKAQKEQEAAQISIDEKAIEEYIKNNNYKSSVKKTESGLYYVVQSQGNGPKVEAGKKVSVNYTGKLLNGNVFDSNTDPKFNHVQPFEFNVGEGQVISGWDEGLQLFNVGGKGILIIPSRLGYGSRGAGGSIPANSVLVFDVELLDAK